jgi:hypothetical protein
MISRAKACSVKYIHRSRSPWTALSLAKFLRRMAAFLIAGLREMEIYSWVMNLY